MNHLKWLEIDLNNLKYNVRNLKLLLEPNVHPGDRRAKFMAVVKSNAYGHGMIKCAEMAIGAGADWLGVVNIEEALELRITGSGLRKTPILVLGYVDLRDFQVAAENNISVAIVNFDQIKELITNGRKLPANLKIHLKIETGISRLGFTENEWPKLIREVMKLPKNIIIEGIYSHFASVEEYNLAYARTQIEKFMKFKKSYQQSVVSSQRYSASCPEPIFHMAASAAAMILPEAHFDMVRCGIAIYGLWPSKETKKSFMESRALARGGKLKFAISKMLKPVLSYKTKIVQIKKISRGDCIGYGCAYFAKKPMLIAIAPVGYAEGFDRGFSNPAPNGNKFGEVLIGGQKCPVVGRVCMNMSAIDITKLKIQFANIGLQGSDSKSQQTELKIGENIVLIGQQGDNIITADEWAEKLGTINYEVTTRIPSYITRIYK